MDAIRNKKDNLSIVAPRVDHSARMDRVDTALQEQSVAVAQLNPQQTSDFRAYTGITLDNIGKIQGLGPSGDIGIAPKETELSIPGTRKTPEERQKELEEKIKEKTDPEFAAKKKAERTASKLNSLFSPVFIGGLGGMIGPGFQEAQQKRDDAKHEADLEIVDVLYSLEGKEMSAVKTEYEKNYGKTLEDEVRSRFRGDTQQTLLGLVKGEGGTQKTDEGNADKVAGVGKNKGDEKAAPTGEVKT